MLTTGVRSCTERTLVPWSCDRAFGSVAKSDMQHTAFSRQACATESILPSTRSRPALSKPADRLKFSHICTAKHSLPDPPVVLVDEPRPWGKSIRRMGNVCVKKQGPKSLISSHTTSREPKTTAKTKQIQAYATR